MGFCGKWTKMVKIVNGIPWQMDENGENSEWDSVVNGRKWWKK